MNCALCIIRIEGDGVADQGILRDVGLVFRDDALRVDRFAVGPFRTLTALACNTDRPDAVVVLTGRDRRKLAERRAVIDRSDFNNALAISSAEGDGPGLDVLCGDGHVGFNDRFRRDFLVAGHPFVEAIAVNFRRCRKLTDRFAVANRSGFNDRLAAHKRYGTRLDIGRGDSHVSRNDGFRCEFFFTGHPLVEDIAFHFRRCRKLADRAVFVDVDALDIAAVLILERDNPKVRRYIERIIGLRNDRIAAGTSPCGMVVAFRIPCTVASFNLELRIRRKIDRDHVLVFIVRILNEFISVAGLPVVHVSDEIVAVCLPLVFRINIVRLAVEFTNENDPGVGCSIKAAAARRCAGQPGITVAGLAIDGKSIALERAARKVKMYRTACRSDCSAFRIGERDADSNRVNSGLSDRVLCHCQR